MGKQIVVNQQVNSNQYSKQKAGGRYLAAFVLVGTILSAPMLAVLATLVIYILPQSSMMSIDVFKLGGSITALILGIIVTLLVWLLLPFGCMRFATAMGGRPSSYDSLQTQLEVLKARLNIVKCTDKYDTLSDQEKATLQDQQKARWVALTDTDKNIDLIDQSINKNGLPWILNTGYISLWKRLYDADEAMIDLLPPSSVIEDAECDERRLQDSDIPDHENLHTLLERATNTLRLFSKPFQLQLQQNQGSNPPQNGTQVLFETEEQARAVIRKVRYVIHKFNSERWEGLVRRRNQLMATAVITGLFTYLLVAIAILAGVLPSQMKQVLVFYFLGAIIGLFGRLSTESNETDSTIDDYGLTMARVMVTPFLAGLAALVGVFLVVILSISLVTPASQATLTTTIFPKLNTIYDYNTYPQNLVFAAIFGYLPNLVLNILQQKSEDVKSQLKSSSAAH